MSSKESIVVTLPVIDYCAKMVRLIAKSGEKNFSSLIKEPLAYGAWEREQHTETSQQMMHRIDRYDDDSSEHAIAPLCKRLVSLSVTESLKNLGNSCIYFLDKMRYFPKVMHSREALDFITILHPYFKQFEQWQNRRTGAIFEEKLNNLSREDLAQAVKPIQLERYKIQVKLQKEAADLLRRIRLANDRDDIPRCQKLIANYLIKFAEQEDNNREQVEAIIEAFTRKLPAFRHELNESMAIALYYEVLAGIQENDLARTVRGIRKYAFIFQGNPDIRNYMEIDRLEKKLYDIIEKKDLWSSLNPDSSPAATSPSSTGSRPEELAVMTS